MSILKIVRKTSVPKKSFFQGTRPKKRVNKDTDDRFFFITLTTVILLLTTLFVYSNWKIVQKKRELEKQLQYLEAQINTLEKEKGILEKELKSITDPKEAEKRLRGAGYQKEGEIPVLIEAETRPAKDTSWFDKIKERLNF